MHGATRGERRRLPTYVRGCGKAYRPGTNFQAHNAEKLLELCDTVGMSVAGFLDALIEWLPLDEEGRPVGWPDKARQEAMRTASRL